MTEEKKTDKEPQGFSENNDPQAHDLSPPVGLKKKKRSKAFELALQAVEEMDKKKIH